MCQPSHRAIKYKGAPFNQVGQTETGDRLLRTTALTRPPLDTTTGVVFDPHYSRQKREIPNYRKREFRHSTSTPSCRSGIGGRTNWLRPDPMCVRVVYWRFWAKAVSRGPATRSVAPRVRRRRGGRRTGTISVGICSEVLLYFTISA